MNSDLLTVLIYESTDQLIYFSVRVAPVQFRTACSSRRTRGVSW